ncbi:unnamed protein product [Darwinula stevensoni]|uniref:Uncharacterized protein n=1 Tax=Darwinula stevensoni TaxID=69355 RepID=A0A7R9A958_9CRUS|nr:unnamed protein product [Darwinula stevensoni]CAG0897090.1 unnamed protein product [Darwinula stevensoni]
MRGGPAHDDHDDDHDDHDHDASNPRPEPEGLHRRPDRPGRRGRVHAQDVDSVPQRLNNDFWGDWGRELAMTATRLSIMAKWLRQLPWRSSAESHLSWNFFVSRRRRDVTRGGRPAKRAEGNPHEGAEEERREEGRASARPPSKRIRSPAQLPPRFRLPARFPLPSPAMTPLRRT